MGLKFNPFLDDGFDEVGSGTSNYQQLFDVTTDWGVASGGFYSIIIPGATHGKGLNPIIQVYELNGSDYELVTASISIDSSNGDVTLGVLEVPDARFEGKIIIAENN